MRCPECSAYIPDGLTYPLDCPQCSKSIAEPSIHFTHEPQSNLHPPFAPWLTIITSAYTEDSENDSTLLPPDSCSISFGKNGFSLVTQLGMRFDKFLYSECSEIKSDSGVFTFFCNARMHQLRFPQSNNQSAQIRSKLICDLVNQLKNTTPESNPFSESLREEIRKRFK